MKKVLVVSYYAFSYNTSCGKTLNSLFSDDQKKNIAQLYFQNGLPESNNIASFYALSELDIISYTLLPHQRQCGKTLTSTADSTKKDSLYGYKVIKFLPFSLKLFIRTLIYQYGRWRSKNLFEWIDDFSPDSILLIAYDFLPAFNIATTIAQYKNIPLDAYILDDHVLNRKPQNIWMRYLYPKLTEAFKDTIQKARHVFVIGEAMAEAYQQYYHQSFIPVMNSIVIPSKTPIKTTFNSTYIDIVYAGNLQIGRDKSLIQVNEILNTLAQQLKKEIRLTVYSMDLPSKKLKQEFKKAYIYFAGSIQHKELETRLNQADFVLHIESFLPQHKQLTKLSVSTKIPEYLVSGACLIAYGPSEIASMQLIEKYQIGLCLTEKDTQEFKQKKLLELLKSSKLRQAYIQKGFALAQEKFDRLKINQMMENLLG